MSLLRKFVRRHFLTFDLRALTPEHRAVVQDALNVLDARMYRIRAATGRRIPVTVSDLSRWTGEASSGDHGAHDHSHGAHALGDPDHRLAALGLYWLPTTAYPAGRIELHEAIMGNVPLAQEVLIAEAAHSYDLTVMTDEQRAAIFAVVHDGNPSDHSGHGWWEEKGNADYWTLMGETFMALFMRAYAPTLPRPLEARQPWTHRVTDQHAAAVRLILK